MSKELLVPVGSMEHLDYAIHNGCDAVYLGGKRFGARAYASNFSDDELKEAIKKCHLYGVKIYVTVNTMVLEREVKSVLEYVDFLAKEKVDAVIVSDIGLIAKIHEQNKELAIHVSTQAHTGSKESMEFFKSLGATRVVIDREMSLEEIKKLPDILEIEVFIHGALCVSYSGECLMSALTEGRSGNRGTCAQYCRMKYRLLKNGRKVDTQGEYLLSTKELNTSHHIKELMQSNITSFKIEGRMKSKEYVGFITRFYRNIMDSCTDSFSLKEEKKLKCLFNREFTEGYLFQSKNIMNFQTQNHIGIPIGKVIECTSQKIKIKLIEDLTQEDGIKFLPSDIGMHVNFLYDDKGKLISHAKKGQVVFLDNKIHLKNLEVVHKTMDKELIHQLQKLEKKRIPIGMVARVTLEQFELEITDDHHTIYVSHPIAEVAQKRSTTKEEIEKNLNRLGSTPFILKDLEIYVADNLFLPAHKINEIRRLGIDKLIEKRLEK